jgi:ubiquinone/menaquinone biosynthesis C-methylase UbiE
VNPFDAEAVRRAYDAVAEDYVLAFADDLADLPVDRSILDAALERIAGVGAVLDLGCGPGQVAGYMASRRVQVVGLDLSTRMLNLAAERTTTVAYTCGDMRSLPYRSGSFSAVVAFYSIQHIPRLTLQDALDEISRVLFPEGLLIVAAHLGVGETYTEEFLGHRTERIGGTFYGDEELHDALRRHSFSIHVSRQRNPLPHEYQSKRIYLLARKNQHLA